MSSCRDLCVPCCLPCETYCPKPWTDACNDLCVRYCEDSRAVIYPPPVAMTFPGAIFSSCPQESVVGSCGPVNYPCIPDCRPCSLRGSSYCGDSSVGRSIASCSHTGSNCGPCSPIWSCRRRCVPF